MSRNQNLISTTLEKDVFEGCISKSLEKGSQNFCQVQKGSNNDRKVFRKKGRSRIMSHTYYVCVFENVGERELST
jgi:hypothetical protein